jgi:hypothetical protein
MPASVPADCGMAVHPTAIRIAHAPTTHAVKRPSDADIGITPVSVAVVVWHE